MLASSPGRFFANITAGEKYVFFSRRAVILAKNWPGDEAKCRTSRRALSLCSKAHALAGPNMCT